MYIFYSLNKLDFCVVRSMNHSLMPSFQYACGCLYALNGLDKMKCYKDLIEKCRGLALATDSG
jgi:hypothetical protein